MNTKIVLGSLAGAVLVHSTLIACSSEKSAGADATTPPVQIAVENCDKTYQIPSPAGHPEIPPTTVHYAEHAYPGQTKEQLAGHVTNWTTVTSATTNVPQTGYGLIEQDVLFVKDGFVGAGCFTDTTTFIYAP